MSVLEVDFCKTRNAMWDAIRNFPGLAGVFKQEYSFNQEEDLMVEAGNPSISDFPSIMILPTSCDPTWWTHEMMKWLVTYDITVSTGGWALPEGERLIELVVEAIYRNAPPGDSVTYVKRASGYHPQQLGAIRWAFRGGDKPGPPKRTDTTVSIALRRQKDPFQAS